MTVRKRSSLSHSWGLALRLAWCALLAIGPANGVQVVAWSSMLASQWGQGAGAVERTFTAAAPCALCQVAAQLRQGEEGTADQPAGLPVKKAEPTWTFAAILPTLPVPRVIGRLPGPRHQHPPGDPQPDPDEPVPRS